MATSVLVLEESIADKFMAKFTQAAKDIKIGNGLDKDVFLGPVIRQENQERTLNYIKTGVKEGAKLVLDGSAEAEKRDGYFVGPTIFEDVKTDMTIWHDEMFAPVLSVMRAKDLPEAVAIANQSELANGACLFTDSTSEKILMRGCWALTWAFRHRLLSSHFLAGNIHSLAPYMLTARIVWTSTRIRRL